MRDHTHEATQDYHEDLKLELHRAMRHTNDLIRRAAQAGMTVNMQTLTIFRNSAPLPQISFSVSSPSPTSPELV